jgi:GNAT superfamily N-acetyltransferase
VRYAEIPDLPGTETRVFAAYGDDTLPVGVLTVDAKHGTVELVFVEEEVRRRGVATALLACARELTGLALELDTGVRSRSGEAWAEANGLRPEWGNLRDRLSERKAEALGAGLMTAVLNDYIARRLRESKRASSATICSVRDERKNGNHDVHDG